MVPRKIRPRSQRTARSRTIVPAGSRSRLGRLTARASVLGTVRGKPKRGRIARWEIFISARVLADEEIPSGKGESTKRKDIITDITEIIDYHFNSARNYRLDIRRERRRSSVSLGQASGKDPGSEKARCSNINIINRSLSYCASRCEETIMIRRSERSEDRESARGRSAFDKFHAPHAATFSDTNIACL